jgi:hypothetical protein
MWQQISDISDVPTGRDVRDAGYRGQCRARVGFPCRRVGFTWVASNSHKPVMIYPTHWQEWRDEP